MYLAKMRPEEIQREVKNNTPVLMAAGVLEYHGPHMPIGTDYLLSEKLCVELERRCSCIIAPHLPFGPTMNWAGGIEEGDIDFDPEALSIYVKEVLKSILGIGFNRIYIIHFHQGPDGLQALCLKKAAAELVREKVKGWGAGWGRRPESAFPNPRIFDCIKVAGLDSFSKYQGDSQQRMPLGHAGKGETQLMLASFPETVCMENVLHHEDCMPDWLKDAKYASREEGERWLEFCIEGWLKELAGA